MDAAKLALSMTPERGMMLQEQNDRLARALRRMATRLDELESRHGHLSGVNGQSTDVLGKSTDNAQHADITAILDRYAPESADLGAMQESLESSHPSARKSVPYQSKKRRVDDDGGDGDGSSEQDGPSHMIVPVSHVQTQQMIDAELPTGNTQPTPTDHMAAATIANPATLDPHLQAYQTLLQMSQAHKTRATHLRDQAGVAPGFPDVANTYGAVPASLGFNGQGESLHLPPGPSSNGSTALNGDFSDTLLDLVDWDMSLESCDPITWDWNPNVQ